MNKSLKSWLSTSYWFIISPTGAPVQGMLAVLASMVTTRQFYQFYMLGWPMEGLSPVLYSRSLHRLFVSRNQWQRNFGTCLHVVFCVLCMYCAGSSVIISSSTLILVAWDLSISKSHSYLIVLNMISFVVKFSLFHYIIVFKLLSLID